MLPKCADQGRGEEDRRPRGDLLYLVVLLDADLQEPFDRLVLLQAHQHQVDAEDVLERSLFYRMPGESSLLLF